MKTNLARETFTILFYAKKGRPLKNGNYAIIIRVTVNGQSVELSLHRDVAPSNWNQSNGLCKRKDKESQDLNSHINTVQSKIYEVYNSMVAAGEIVTAQRINDKYLKKDVQKEMVGICKLYEDHNERCAALIGIDYSESTIVKFRSTLKSLREFILVKYGTDDYNIQDISPDFMRDYEFYLKVSKGFFCCLTVLLIQMLQSLVTNTYIKMQMGIYGSRNVGVRRRCNSTFPYYPHRLHYSKNIRIKATKG